MKRRGANAERERLMRELGEEVRREARLMMLQRFAAAMYLLSGDLAYTPDPGFSEVIDVKGTTYVVVSTEDDYPIGVCREVSDMVLELMKECPDGILKELGLEN